MTSGSGTNWRIPSPLKRALCRVPLNSMGHAALKTGEKLQGYTLPMSSSGMESFVTPPPWHFSGDVIWIEFEARPDSIAAFLPPGLELGESAGACGAVFVDW